MALKLGVPEAILGVPLGRRLAWTIGVRLVFLVLLLVLVAWVFGGSRLGSGGFTAQAALITLAGGFALAASYAALLRRGRAIVTLAHTQLVLDQVTWTVVAYLTGGAASGATSLYGLTCVVGATLLGLGGAAWAAVSAGALYGGLLAGLYSGWLPPPPDQPITVYQFGATELGYYLLLDWLMLAVVALLAGYLAERLRLTGGQLVRAEERAEQAERMAALGRLAAGLAHEIRNPLGSIAGSIELLQSNSGMSAEDHQLCDIIRREADRLNDLVTDMTDLYRPRRPEPTSIDLAEVARELVCLAGRSGRGIGDVKVVYRGAERVRISADPAELRQMIWNLVRNAVQASSPGDEVTVRAEIAGGEARLAVEDHGIGLDEEARTRLFDAFFTTRSQGTGIGLAVVKRIADEHGFRIDVSSEHGQGAVFTVSMGPVIVVRGDGA
jgi:two-component system, NtrC family, sensor histidine kinase HydH